MMTSHLRVICAAVMFTASLAWAGEVECLQCPTQGDTVVFYVDADTTVQPSNSWMYHIDRIDRPVPDIAMAKQLIRDMRAQCSGLSGPTLNVHIRVEIREGTYAPDTISPNNPLPIPLAFTSDDSGVDQYPITYAAYSTDGGQTFESVLISGGVKMEGWSQTQPGAWWAADLPWPTVDWRDEMVPRDLYINNVRGVRAREPDAGFATVLSHEYITRLTGTGTETAWHGLFYDPSGTDPKSIPPSPLPDMSLGAKINHNEYFINTDYSFPQQSSERGYRADRGTECVLRWRGVWASFRQYVIQPHHNGQPGRIRLWDAIDMPADDSEFDIIDWDTEVCGRTTEVYLENAKEFMDQDFEWWFNPPGTDGTGENRIWVILPESLDPTGEDPTKDLAKLVVAHANQLFEFDNASHINLEHLNFAYTRQPLPQNHTYDKLINAENVATWNNGEYDRIKKSIVEDPTTTPSRPDLEYPQIGWFERGRALRLYNTDGTDAGSARFVHDAVVRISRGQGVRLSRCRIAHAGGAGVIVESGDEHEISQCEIFDIGGSAIVVSRENQSSHFGIGPDNDQVPQQFMVSNNYIYDVGKTYISSPAIYLGWTATDEATGSAANDGGAVLNNYIGSVPGEGIRAGYQSADSLMSTRSQSRNLLIENNVVRDPVRLMDDMSGIGVVYDGDGNCEITENIVYSTNYVTDHAKHAFYTDGKGMGLCGTSGWQWHGNVSWNFERPYHMNPKFTCPEDNEWFANVVDLQMPRINCPSCKFQDKPACPNPSKVGNDCVEEWSAMMDTFKCPNGESRNQLHILFDATPGGVDPRYLWDANLADNCLRSPLAKGIIDVAGPQDVSSSLQSDTRIFLFTKYESLIHPTLPAAMDRTPPSLTCP